MDPDRYRKQGPGEIKLCSQCLLSVCPSYPRINALLRGCRFPLQQLIYIYIHKHIAGLPIASFLFFTRIPAGLRAASSFAISSSHAHCIADFLKFSVRQNVQPMTSMHASRCNGALSSSPTPSPSSPTPSPSSPTPPLPLPPLPCLLLVILRIVVFVAVVVLLLLHLPLHSFPACPLRCRIAKPGARATICAESLLKHEDNFFPERR